MAYFWIENPLPTCKRYKTPCFIDIIHFYLNLIEEKYFEYFSANTGFSEKKYFILEKFFAQHSLWTSKQENTN